MFCFFICLFSSHTAFVLVTTTKPGEVESQLLLPAALHLRQNKVGVPRSAGVIRAGPRIPRVVQVTGTVSMCAKAGKNVAKAATEKLIEALCLLLCMRGKFKSTR